MEPLKIYNYLVLSRERVLEKVRGLTAEQYTQQFPIGLGSLAATLTHTMTAEWYYVQRMLQRDVPPDDQWPIQEQHPPPFATLEAAWRQQSADTLAALDAVRETWLNPIEYRMTDDNGRRILVTASAADVFTQLVLHEVHHRAQAMNILRHLGAPVGADIDFNMLMYNRREAQ